MAAEVNILSQGITALDAGITGAPAPAQVGSGKGAAGKLWTVDDYVQNNATSIQTAGSYYRLLRIPTNAFVKALYISTDKALDSNASNTLAFDVGIAFSDSLYDGTRPEQQALIPTTANDGVTTTTFAAYSAPNKLFGGITASAMGHTAAYNSGNLVFNGLTTGYTLAGIAQQPLWQLFGFVDGRGYAMNPGGMFDIYLYATTGAATGVAGTIYGRCDYIL